MKNTNTYFTMKFGDKEIYIEMSEMLVASEWINKEETDKCYLAIFPNDNAKDTDTFYLGQLYFKKYYTYFDAGNGTT